MAKRSARVWVAGLAWVAVLAGTAGVSLGAGTIVDLGHLSTNYYGGSGPVVSADGRVVAGTQQNAQGFNTPYRWTAETGIQSLSLPGIDNAAEVKAVNADGSVIVGQAMQTAVPSYEAFKWTASGGSVGLGGTYASGVTGDGKTAVGADVHGPGIVTWSEDGTMTPVSGFNTGIVNGISGDGSVIVGWDGSQAVGWTQQTGLVSLPLLPGGATGQAMAVSGNGATIVGYNSSLPYDVPPGLSDNDHLAFRWTADGGMVELGHLEEKSPGHYDVTAQCMNDDGSVVGGFDWTGGAFVWDELHGMRSLRDVLGSAGLGTPGWHLGDVTGISADGLTLVGIGQHDGVPSHFLVQVPASVWVPEPTTGGLALAALAAVRVLHWRRHHRQA